MAKVVIWSGETSYTYYATDRVLEIDHLEKGMSQTATVVLNNWDGALTSLDLRSYALDIYYGATTSAGDEYSLCAPLKVRYQQQESSPERVVVILKGVGLYDRMQDDEASEIYVPTLTETTKTLLGKVIDATLASYDLCQAYPAVEWDSEDSLIDVYTPQLNLIVGESDRRSVIVDKCLGLTKCVGRFENDGKFHVFVPTTTGTTYAYQYITGAGTHSIFSEKYRLRTVIPNYVTVASLVGNVPAYSGYATDASYTLERHDAIERLRVVSSAQCTTIAEALIAKAQIGQDGGSCVVPLNCGAEVFDYVKATNAQAVERVGNIGWLHRKVNSRKAIWDMTFGFGKWLESETLSRDLTVTALGYKLKDASVTNITIKKITNVGDDLLHSNDTELTFTDLTYTSRREILIPLYGYFRVKFDLQGNFDPTVAAYGKIYRRRAGVSTAIGTERSEDTGTWTTYSEDLSSFMPGDILELQVKKGSASGTTKARNFRLYYDVDMSQTGEFVNLL